MHDDDFWREYEILHDHEYFNEHKQDYSSAGKGSHPVYWSVVCIVSIILAIALPDSPGVALFFFAMALSFSVCL